MLAQPGLNTVQIASNHRTDGGVYHRSAGAEILAEFRCYFCRKRDQRCGKNLLDYLPRANFVHRVYIGMKQTNRDRLHSFTAQRLSGLPHIILVQRGNNPTLCIQPFPHPETQVARHQRRRFFEAQIVERGADLASNLQDIPKTFRGDKTRPRNFSFDNGIGGDCSPMDEV